MRPLYVRLPSDQARRLDQAASALSAHKKDLVAGLVDRYVRPDEPESLAELREIAGTGRRSPRIELDLGEPGLTVGHHAFRPAPVRDVLDAEQAAELFSVTPDAVVELAQAGKLPGRKIGDEWRFARQALLDWLAAGDA